jgi:hypothetical protein
MKESELKTDRHNRPIQKSELKTKKQDWSMKESELKKDRHNRPIQKSELKTKKQDQSMKESELKMDRHNRPIQNWNFTSTDTIGRSNRYRKIDQSDLSPTSAIDAILSIHRQKVVRALHCLQMFVNMADPTLLHGVM